MIDPADLEMAARFCDAPHWARGRAVPPLLRFLGVEAGLAEQAPRPVQLARLSRLLRLAASLDRVFALSLPGGGEATFFGATSSPSGARERHYGGAATTRLAAFCACAGEAAEDEAMLRSRQASGGTLASSTGFAAGATLSGAVRSALLECAERHAIALWLNGKIRPGRMVASRATLAANAALRGAAAPAFLALHSHRDVVTVAVWSQTGPAGFAIGYGAHASAQGAARKALRELAQCELDVRLTAAAGGDARTAIVDGRYFVRAEHLARPELFSPWPGVEAARVALGPAMVEDLTSARWRIPTVRVRVKGLRDIAADQ